MRPARLGLAIGGVAALMLISSLTWGLVSAAQRAPINLVGQAAPALTLRSLQDGREIRVANLRGTPVVLNFWASWCVPCRQEAPVLNAAARRYDGRVQFLGADIKDNDQAARAYLTELAVPYPAGPITRGSEKDFGVNAPPDTFFIDRQGSIVSRITGPVDARRLNAFLGLVQP